MRTLILTGGTSVLDGFARIGVTLPAGHEAAALTRAVITGIDPRVSAEVATLRALAAGANDNVVLLVTDTPDGERAGRLNALVAEELFGVPADVVRVSDLRLDAADRFRRFGLTRLFEALDKHVNRAAAEGREALIGISAGIKAVIPHVAAYGMLRRVPLYYLFQQPERLLVVPRFPLGFDFETLHRAAGVLAAINRETSLPAHRVRNDLGDDYWTLEGLFDEDGDQITLSPFGLLLLSDLEDAEATQVRLSRPASDALRRSNGLAREQLEFMLSRSRNPMWRATKYHKIEGTDLDAYKPGNTAQRMAGWVDRNVVYVAELYADHDTYLRHLPTRRRKDYPPGEFSTWTPTRTTDILTPDEEAGAQLIADAQSRIAAATRMSDEALLLAASHEERAAGLVAELGEVRRAHAEALTRSLRAEEERDRLNTVVGRFLGASRVTRLVAAWRGRL